MSRLVFLVVLCAAFANATLSKNEIDEITQKILSESRSKVVIGDKDYFIATEVDLMWWDALEICNAMGKTIASLETAEESALVKEYITANAPLNNFWISLKEIDTNEWMWAGSGQIATFFDWSLATEEPNETGFPKCVHMKPDGWYDDLCNMQKNFICE